MVSGPSGTGKGTLVERIRRARPDLGLTVSATTRDPRPGEVDGVAYHFLTEEAFSRAVDEGAFVEWAEVFGHRYGTLVSEVRKNLDAGRSVILEIDVQGALNVHRTFPDAVLVFIAPPSPEELERRLRGRGTEDEATIRRRLARAAKEMELAGEYDVTIVNDDLDLATEELLSAIRTHEN